MIGFICPQNFDIALHRADSITDFWRRWHISLSTGCATTSTSRSAATAAATSRTYVNLMHHHAARRPLARRGWNFVVWGGLHGAALAAHKFWNEEKGSTLRIPKFFELGRHLRLCLFLLDFLPRSDLHRCQRNSAQGALPRPDWRPVSLPATLPRYPRARRRPLPRPRRRKPRQIRRPSPLSHAARLGTTPLPVHPQPLRPQAPHRRRDITSSFPYPAFGEHPIATLWVFILYFFATVNSSPFIYFQF